MIPCSNCKKQEAVTRLAYSRTDLCGNCFCSLFEERVRQANKRYRMLRLNQKIAVGVSGGKDSAAMLYVLSKLVRNVHGAELIPIAIDEGIKGYRNESLEKARELCEKLGMELRVRSFSDEYGKGMDDIIEIRDGKASQATVQGASFRPQPSCSYCGVMRRQSLNKAALGEGADVLAVGHNADDVAQTFLMNLFRSEPQRFGETGAATTKKEGFVPRIRPLIFNLERECALYCELGGLPYYRGGCPYAHESFRGEVKDFLNELEERHPGTKFNLLQSCLSLEEKLGPEKWETLDEIQVHARKAGKCISCGQNSWNEKCRACEMLEELA